MATLLKSEAHEAKRLLENASIPCSIATDPSQGGFETFDILVRQAQFDQASELLNQHIDDVFKEEEDN